MQRKLNIALKKLEMMAAEVFIYTVQGGGAPGSPAGRGVGLACRKDGAGGCRKKGGAAATGGSVCKEGGGVAYVGRGDERRSGSRKGVGSCAWDETWPVQV